MENSGILYGDVSFSPECRMEIYAGLTKNIPDFDKVNIIQLSFENNFSDNEDAIIELYIQDWESNEIYYSLNIPLIHLAEKGLNNSHRGEFNFQFTPFEKRSPKKIISLIHSKNTPVDLKNIKVSYFEFY